MDLSRRVVGPLLLLQLSSVAFLWSLDSLNLANQDIFALFLAADFLAFATVARVYRVNRSNGFLSRNWMIGACCVIILLLLVSLLVA